MRERALSGRCGAFVALSLPLQHVPQAARIACRHLRRLPGRDRELARREPTRYRSSKDVERSFCPICGSTIGFHRAHETSLAVGGFDAPEALPVAGVSTMHVWFKEHLPWFDTADDWPRYAEFPPGRTEELIGLSGRDIKG